MCNLEQNLGLTKGNPVTGDAQTMPDVDDWLLRDLILIYKMQKT